MQVIEASSYAELSCLAADRIAAVVIGKKKCVLGLATGSTPIGTYGELIKKHEAGRLDFSDVTSVNLDEYVGLDPENEQSYRYFMNTNLFDHVNIDKARTFVPNGKADDIKAEGAAYDKRIEDLGGIDLQLLGIGHNGHIGFNEPDEVFVKETHLVDLKETTIAANTRFFEKEADVPRQAITMGMGAIMAARKVLLLISGEDKMEIFKKSVYGPITPSVPASILQLHPDLTVIFSKNK